MTAQNTPHASPQVDEHPDRKEHMSKGKPMEKVTFPQLLQMTSKPAQQPSTGASDTIILADSDTQFKRIPRMPTFTRLLD